MDKALTERFLALLNEWILIAEVERDTRGQLEWMDVRFQKNADPDATLCEFVGALVDFANNVCPEGHEVAARPSEGFSLIETEDKHGRQTARD